MPPERTSTSVAPAMNQAAIRQLINDRVAAALEAQAANMANTDNTNRNPKQALVARKCSYKEFMSCQPFNFKATTTAGQPPPPPPPKIFSGERFWRTQKRSLSPDLLDPPYHSPPRATTTPKVTTTAAATVTIHTTTIAATTTTDPPINHHATTPSPPSSS
nr:hypothetical protein [Tanacetum cinerariifolium]